MNKWTDEMIVICLQIKLEPKSLSFFIAFIFNKHNMIIMKCLTTKMLQYTMILWLCNSFIVRCLMLVQTLVFLSISPQNNAVSLVCHYNTWFSTFNVWVYSQRCWMSNVINHLSDSNHGFWQVSTIFLYILV